VRPLVIIPSHNEVQSLPDVVADVCAQAIAPEDILIVDDGSSDATSDLLPRLGVRHVRLRRRLGIGGALRAGIRYVLELGYDTVVRLDADGQHPAQYIPLLLRPLGERTADAVLGSRYLGPSEYTTTPLRRVAQQTLALGLSAVLRRKVSDPTSGYWAFGPRALDVLARHHPSGYPEPELLLLLSRNRLKLVEVAVGMRRRLAGRTSLTPHRAGLAMARALWALAVEPLKGPLDGAAE